MAAPTTAGPRSVTRRGRRTAWPIAVLTILAVSLAACTGSADGPGPSSSPGESGPVSAGPPNPDEWRSQVSFEPLGVPGEMVATADRLDLGGLVAGTAERPALLAAIRTTAQGRRDLDVSVWDGTAWQPADVGTDVPGEPQDAVIAGNESVAAIGGSTWESGTVWPYLVTSTDRATWTAAQLPSSLSGFTIVAVAVDGGRVVALAQNAAHNAATVVIDPTGEPVVTAVPAVPQGQYRDLASLAVAGDTVVLTGTQDASRSSAPKSFVSSDGGRTWAEPTAISASAEATVSGVVAVPGGFVATGRDLVPDNQERESRASAWFSTDGGAWQAESVPEPEGFRWDGYDSTLGVPRTAGGYVLAIASSTSNRSAQPYQRQPTGEWIALTETNQVADGVGFGGQVVPVHLPTGTDAPARTFVAIEGAHGLSVADVRSGQWSNLIAPGSYIDPYFFYSAQSGGTPGWRAVIRQRNFARFGDTGFRWWYEPAEVTLTADALTALDWDPPAAAGADDVRRGTDGSAEVVLATRFTDDPERWVVDGWSRASADQPWQAASGFGAEQAETVDGVGYIGSVWVAWGRHGTGVGSTDHAMLWYSTDGVNWSRADGDFGPPDGGSQISHVCAGPNGEAVAVGSINGSDQAGTATRWAADPSGRWQPTPLAGTPGTASRFAYCATVDGRLWIRGFLDGADRRWQVGTDGVPAPAADPGADSTQPSADPTASSPQPNPASSELSVPQPVSGGFVATGRLDRPAYTGPVIWLSADGENWTWVPVAADRPDVGLLADDVDGDLVVLSSSPTASRAWRIRDIATVIASIPPTS